MKVLIAILLILPIVFIAGCTQTNSVICKPNWVYAYSGGPYVDITDDACKAQCYNVDKVTTSYKIESVNACQCILIRNGANNNLAVIDSGSKDPTPEICVQTCQKQYSNLYGDMGEITGTVSDKVINTCYCDVNNCNPNP